MHAALCAMCIHRISRYSDKHSLSSQQRLYAAVILPYKSGIPSFPPSPCCSETFTLPSRSLSRAAKLAPFPGVVRMANGTVCSSHSCSFLWHFHVGCSLLFVVDWAGCGWFWFFLELIVNEPEWQTRQQLAGEKEKAKKKKAARKRLLLRQMPVLPLAWRTGTRGLLLRFFLLPFLLFLFPFALYF